MNDDSRPDLDCREHIEQFIDRFYQQVLQDGQLAPIFLNVAQIDLQVHLPHIKNYWCKLLLGDKAYRRHTMNIHRTLHSRQTLTAGDFQRWLGLFSGTLDASYAGPYAEKARRIAGVIAENMQQGLAI